MGYCQHSGLHRTQTNFKPHFIFLKEIDCSFLFEPCPGRQHTCDRLLKVAGMTMNMAPCVYSRRVELIVAQLLPILWGPIVPTFRVAKKNCRLLRRQLPSTQSFLFLLLARCPSTHNWR